MEVDDEGSVDQSLKVAHAVCCLLLGLGAHDDELAVGEQDAGADELLRR